MRRTVHRHLGKVVAGAAIAVAGTAVMIGITLPGSAGADGRGGTGAGRGDARPAADAAGPGGAVRPGVVERAPAQGAKGVGRDPLTDDELRRVEHIAESRSLLTAGENVEGGRGPQRLGADLAEPELSELDDPAAPRRADVRFYDYKDDSLVTRTVNLDTGRVEHTGVQHDVQPPISRAEMTQAADLLIADPLGAGLKADYRDATGKDLTSAGQFLLSSMVYRATPGAQPAVLDACGRHRCVRLFPKVRNGPWIDSRDLVIDLSTRTVGKLG
ncbi:Tat pathway signal sequence domain protein [Streptomyces sp. NPDC048566]|uniref:Tat pathway signal sequence domain protein n=1 Tax=Streptomyces sp. NPDC048566 TaxID=3365569 RepID=UPI00371DED2A